MSYRDSNYCAFYVNSPFNSNNLSANASKDFCYYNLLKAWKEKYNDFLFKDAHQNTYNVRDDSEWETLKQRLHERINTSKNIILFLSSVTKNSKALKEEIFYGIYKKRLPIILIYPEMKELSDIYNTYIDCNKVKKAEIKYNIIELWNKLPVFKNYMFLVPTLHIPLKFEIVKWALKNECFKVQTKINPGTYVYPGLLLSDMNNN